MSSSEDAAKHGFVAEAVGPSLSAREAAAVIALGVIGLLMAGLMPVLLGALADEHRLSAAGIGQCAMAEAFSTGLFAALAGVFLKTEKLRLIGFAASLALLAAEIATTFASGGGVVLVRALAGLPQGLLIWIAIGMIARSETPERWAGVFLTAITAAQLVLALAFAFYVLPNFGANGGFIGLAVAVLPGAAIAFFAPKRYAPLVKPEGETGAPPLRGWFALFAVVVFTASFGAVSVYLQPLAHEAGLNADVARTALWVSLAAQVAGGTAATAVAGRVHYLPVFIAGTLVFLAVWTVFSLAVPGWLFVAANSLGGFTYLMMNPFLVPMLIEADPSRRAAMLGAGAQVLAGAMGPLASSFLVSDGDVHGALYLGAGLILSGLLMIAGMHAVAVRDRARRQIVPATAG